RYDEPTTPPFFPQIEVVFQVADPSVHYHVPVVVSPYGYSTYRGN
ncbi:MAG TPA: hydroxyisourate hydrolase, partial [Brevundimonas sp.]